ncbi:MAG: thioesterase [Flammeovirgaceae bacterium]|nr:thioesterase [Flammeovirgaceae bacterium]HCX21983.1 thioesterase [Cytophagales bacterium]|tara:strand:+ start:105 stop:500 length:396 start_codon:yes stop_codon:yes gene_type:complete
MSEPIKHQKQIIVQPADIDQLNHVNNTVYLKWVQDISEEHWYKQTTPDIQAQYVWMVLEHHIKYKKQAMLGDEITAVTYVHEMTGVRSIRHVEFYKDDQLLVECHSHWCMLDAESLRPKRIPEDLKELFRR